MRSIHPTPKQRRYYRWQAAELSRLTGHYGDDERRALMQRVTGRTTSAHLTREELADLIDEQQRILRQCHAKYQETPRRGRARLTQDGYIALLNDELGWKGQPERLAGMIRREFGGWKSSVDQLTTQEKSTLISALKKMRDQARRGEIRRERPAGVSGAKKSKTWKPSVVRGGMAQEHIGGTHEAEAT